MRAYVAETILDPRGNVVVGASVRVEGSDGNLIADTLYSAPTGTDWLANPLTADSTGGVAFYLNRSQRVYLRATRDGVTSASVARDTSVPFDAWVDVRSYGAQGNGTTNDTAAIQAAIDAASASGGLVYLPPGTYLINTPPLYLKSRVTLMGAGAASILKLGASAANHLLRATGATRTDIRVTNLALDGNYANQSATRQCVNLDSVTRLQLDHLTVYGSYGDGILLNYCIDVAISSVFAYDIGRNGIAFVHTSGLGYRNTVSDCVVVGRSGAATRNAGYDLEASTDLVLSNIVADGFLYGLVVKASADGLKLAADVGIINLMSRNCTSYDLFYDGRNGQISRISTVGLIVKSDSVNGIRVEEDVAEWSISDVIIGASANANAQTDGISISRTTIPPQGGRIQNSTIEAHKRNGVSITANDVMLSGLRIVDCGLAGSGNGIAVVNATGIVMTGCRIASNAEYGVKATGTSDYLTLVGNDLRGNGVGSTSLVGANNVLVGNQV
jgi:hypothetical protein